MVALDVNLANFLVIFILHSACSLKFKLIFDSNFLAFHVNADYICSWLIYRIAEMT